MIWIDYIIISIIILSSLIGLIRGFICEVLSLITWICAFFITNHYYSYFVINLFNFKKQIVRDGITITLLFISILIIGAVINYTICLIMKKTSLSGIDRVLGICFGALRGILVILAMFFFFNTFTSFSYSQDWQQSQLIPQINKISRLFLAIYRAN